ncbi:UNKNOWN [Stylonychia lemnae]|uniref:Uncharacterized protein n=1 Tax=Stylonychia lemnae TaxID=5949 RepID=A0A077ZU09_STYLE|nr:UNKNOWN [Stylonychia lemnae]|eukprot:CDW73383.1 UNKNOWN [Stylonychia lemnae]
MEHKNQDIVKTLQEVKNFLATYVTQKILTPEESEIQHAHLKKCASMISKRDFNKSCDILQKSNQRIMQNKYNKHTFQQIQNRSMKKSRIDNTSINKLYQDSTLLSHNLQFDDISSINENTPKMTELKLSTIHHKEIILSAQKKSHVSKYLFDQQQESGYGDATPIATINLNFSSAKKKIVSKFDQSNRSVAPLETISCSTINLLNECRKKTEKKKHQKQSFKHKRSMANILEPQDKQQIGVFNDLLEDFLRLENKANQNNDQVIINNILKHKRDSKFKKKVLGWFKFNAVISKYRKLKLIQIEHDLTLKILRSKFNQLQIYDQRIFKLIDCFSSLKSKSVNKKQVLKKNTQMKTIENYQQKIMNFRRLITQSKRPVNYDFILNQLAIYQQRVSIIRRFYSKWKDNHQQISKASKVLARTLDYVYFKTRLKEIFKSMNKLRESDIYYEQFKYLRQVNKLKDIVLNSHKTFEVQKSQSPNKRPLINGNQTQRIRRNSQINIPQTQNYIAKTFKQSQDKQQRQQRPPRLNNAQSVGGFNLNLKACKSPPGKMNMLSRQYSHTLITSQQN